MEELYLEHKTEEEIHNLLEEMHDVDIAEYLEDEDSDEQLIKVLHSLDIEDRAAILEESDEELQLRIINLISEEEVLDIFHYMSPDDIADILGYINFEKRKSLLNQMKRSEANKLKELMGYDSESAGGLMTTQYIAFKKNLSVGDVLDKIKLIAPRTEYIETIFILETNGELIGEADLRDILIYPQETILEDLTDYNIKYVYPEVDQEEVARQVLKYSLKVMPVVNNKKKLLGIITLDDIVTVVQEESTEDMLKLAGTDDESIFDTFSYSLKKRFPWLLINLATAFLASLTVGLFESSIDKVVALAVAMPIVSGIGGNAGTQSLAVTIRSIALGEYKTSSKLEIILKYILTGTILGSILGILGAGLMYLMFKSLWLCLIIFLAMVGNCIIACLSGFIIPIFLNSKDIDPAMASAVILTTFTDVCGFFLFLGLATIVIDKLI